MHASGSPRGRQSPPAATDSSIADGDFLRSDSDESVRRGRHKVDRWRHGFDCNDKAKLPREDWLKVFATGGLSNRFGCTYVYKECPDSKVAAAFEASGNPEDQWTEMPEERSMRMSMPVRQYGVTD